MAPDLQCGGMTLHRIIAIALVAALPFSAGASTDICEQNAAAAAARHDLPDGLLRAIARTESGRSVDGSGPRAWPWTANVAGRGFYFDTRDAALAHLDGVLATGQTSFDVGCMQLNYRWHGDRFGSLGEMIDPARNTDYAARYLRELYAETGDWDTATRYYHSRTPAYGTAYLERVRNAMAGLDPLDAAPAMLRGMPAQTGGPLITVVASRPYWDVAGLGAGAYPTMPD